MLLTIAVDILAIPHVPVVYSYLSLMRFVQVVVADVEV
jgi:hypothetical protein